MRHSLARDPQVGCDSQVWHGEIATIGNRPVAHPEIIRHETFHNTDIMSQDEAGDMRLFCYGTLQFPAILQQVCGHRSAGLPAVLDNHACYLVRGEVFPGLVPEQQARTRGVVYDGLCMAQLRRIDAFETGIYQRCRVVVHDDSERPLQAWAYVVHPDARVMLTDESWDRGLFEQLHMQQFMRGLTV